MSDIFVSYDDQDRPRVRRIVEALEARGWSVWWDHRISTGEAFASVIERELEAARCVVVVWTKTSVHSEWVRAEADEAWKRRTLVPVLLDRVKPPMPFGQIQAADLVDWHEQGHHGLVKLIADLHERVGKAPLHVEKTPRVARFHRSRKAAGIGVALLIAVAAIAWYLRPSSEREPSAAENARADAKVAGTTDVATVSAPAPTPDGDDAAGHWQARVTYPDGASFEERFTFEVAGRKLSGTASMRGYGYRRAILEGIIDGNRLSFRTTGTVQSSLFSVRDVTYMYRGTLERDAIRLTIQEEETGDPAVAFTARRISADQANRIATGGTQPRLSGMDTSNLYQPNRVRELIGGRQGAMDACYQAAEFDKVNHEFVDVRLTLGATGALEQFEMRPEVASLESCIRNVLSAIPWGPTGTGKGGAMRLSITARLPWNP
jgi:hypothetical protein